MLSLSIAASSGESLSSSTISASTLSDYNEDASAVVDSSNFTTRKIFDKRSSPSGIQCKCELE
jgi:hypothetical protein